MKKLTVGVIIIAFLLAVLATVPLFFEAGDAEAGPLKITRITVMYSCNLKSGISCTEGTYHFTESYNPLWHILRIGRHPHSTVEAYVTRNIVDTVEACGDCLGPR